MADARVDAFLADVLALEGENTDEIHDGVHIALKDCENIFRAQRSESTHEGQSCACLPCVMPRSGT